MIHEDIPIGSMGLVYLATFNHENQPNVGKYISPRDPSWDRIA